MRGRRPVVGNRAISKEGMAAIAFGLTVAMMAVTGGLLIQSGEDLDAGGPILSASAEPIDATENPNEQWLRIVHESGDAVDVANLSINVTIRDHRKRATLHGLPTEKLSQTDYDGNHLFSLGRSGVGGEATPEEGDGVWTAGETIELRIEASRVDLEAGEDVSVSVYHVTERRQLFSGTAQVV
jgi:hypothetical protein